MNTCIFCKKTFSRKPNLVKHQKITKYCIKIQKEQSISRKNEFKRICSFCNKTLSSKKGLKRHHNTCKKKKIQEADNDIRDKTVKELKLEVEELKVSVKLLLTKNNSNNSTTTNSNNSTINNHITITHPITNSAIKKIVQAFTLETFKNGAQGIADLLIENKPPNSIICRDRSRQIFEWKSDENTVIKDKHLYHLMIRLCKSLKTRSGSLLKKAVDSITEIYNTKIEVDKAKGLPDKFISAYCDTKIKLIDTYKKYAEDIATMSRGTICEATKEFSRIIGIKLLPDIENSEDIENDEDIEEDDLINMMLRNIDESEDDISDSL